MNEFLDAIVVLFRDAPPFVKFILYLICLGCTLVMPLLLVRNGRRLRLAQRERDIYRKQCEQVNSERSDEQQTFEAEREKLLEEIHQLKGKAERDHWQLDRALPAFNRVTKQNEQLREMLKKAEAHIKKLEAKLAELRQAIDKAKRARESQGQA